MILIELELLNLEKAQGDLSSVYKYLMEEVKNTKPGYSQ